MKITEQKVKTLISIELSLKDIGQAVSNYGKDGQAHRYPRAFEFVDPAKKHLIEKAVSESFVEEIFLNGNGDTYNYLAQYFGFDGWHNAGYFNRGRHSYCMEVFNRGDTLTPQFIKEAK